MKPLIDDVEAFVLIDAEGEARRCSRAENADLFRLAIGGYGLFGVDRPRHAAADAAAQGRAGGRDHRRRRSYGRVRGADPDGFLYGDFQFSTDQGADDFLDRGVFSCYRPVADDVPIAAAQKELTEEDWARLLYFGARRSAAALTTLYTAHYLADHRPGLLVGQPPAAAPISTATTGRSTVASRRRTPPRR